MRMTLENWAKNSWLEKRAADREEIERLLALADGRLVDYEKAAAAKLSPDVQLGLAYDAIRACATAALRAAGYRVVRGGGGEHYRTIDEYIAISKTADQDFDRALRAAYIALELIAGDEE